MRDVRRPDGLAVEWAERAVGARVVEFRGLRDGGSPWLLRFDGNGGEAVLRVASPGDAAEYKGLCTEVAALELAKRHGIAAPRLLAADLERGAAVLTTVVPGYSTIPRIAGDDRLRALGAAAAALHAVPLDPTSELPVRTRPIETVDFAVLRRESGTTPLLAEAEAAIERLPRPAGMSVLVHGDLWQGNVLWADGAITGIVDWDCAGCGHPGVDLGSLRCDAAIAFGPGTVDAVAEGWAAVTGREPPDLPYWDVVAALSSPPDLGYFLSAYAGQGRDDLDQADTVRRRDQFLLAALDRLS